MVISSKEVDCLRVKHRKSDDFQRVIYFEKQCSQDPIDISAWTLRWDFFVGAALHFSIYGSDITITDNAAKFKKEASYFADMPLIGEYSHRLYEVSRNETLFHGSLVLEGPGYVPSPAPPSSNFYGPSAVSVVDADDITSLAYNSPGTSDTFTLQTGSSQKKFIIAIPSSKTLVSVIDQSALNINITAEYEPHGVINVGNIAYDVYEMNISIPYTLNHNHFVTIQ